ncbi:hypothetical protein [Methylococcus geothermalis]|nr:hypothetical protein [Methylococcus geothermalis]
MSADTKSNMRGEVPDELQAGLLANNKPPGKGHGMGSFGETHSAC